MEAARVCKQVVQVGRKVRLDSEKYKTMMKHVTEADKKAEQSGLHRTCQWTSSYHCEVSRFRKGNGRRGVSVEARVSFG